MNIDIVDQIADQCETLDQARGVIRALLLSEPRALDPAINAGISLRDCLAGMAMQGILAAWGAHGISQYEEIANHAYKVAEAMIVARGKA